MLNIISRSWNNPAAGAVHKVFKNLALGLDRIGYPYVVNKALDSCGRLWIHDDYRALLALRRLDPRMKVLVGPNLFVMPRDISRGIRIPDSAVYLHPSSWVVDAWRHMGYAQSRLDYWPVGIDTTGFPGRDPKKLDQVLFYYKHRDRPGTDGAARIEGVLKRLQIAYQRINYGDYDQANYLAALSRTKYVIWYGRQESQGLALQEALAMGCPIIVIDVARIGDWDSSGYPFTDQEQDIPATSAPYFDDRCGIKIRTIDKLEGTVKIMEESFNEYSPERFIAENLTPEICARQLIAKFDRWWLGEPDFVPPASAELPEFRPPRRWVLLAIRNRVARWVSRCAKV